MIIIWGTRVRKVELAAGAFYCPKCGAQRPYRHLRVARYFTLFFIPLFQIENLGEYVECSVCGQGYKPEILHRKAPAQIVRHAIALRADLDAGFPVQMALRRLQNAGADKETARQALVLAAGGNWRTCPKCGLLYRDTIDRCSNCGTELLPAEKISVGSSNDRLQKARELIDKGELATAVGELTMAIELDPQCAGAYANRSTAYAMMGQYDSALADCNTVIELIPSHAEAYNNRGLVYRERGEYNKALGDFAKSISLRPDFADAYYNRGVTYRRMGHYRKALSDYDKVIRLNPEDSAAYNARGIAHSCAHEYEKAIADYSKAIELDPGYAEAFSNRGFACIELGLGAQAIADLERFLEIGTDPEAKEQARQQLRILREAQSS